MVLDRDTVSLGAQRCAVGRLCLVLFGQSLMLSLEDPSA